MKINFKKNKFRARYNVVLKVGFIKLESVVVSFVL